MSLYSDAAAKARALLTRYGTTGRIEADSVAAMDATGNTAVTVATEDLPMVRTELSARLTYSGAEEADCQFFIAAPATLPPATGARVLFAGVRYTVLRAFNIGPAGETIVWRVLAKNA